MKKSLLLQSWILLVLLFFNTRSYGQGWVQSGSSINGIAAGDNAGTAVSVSANGQMLAVTSFSAASSAGQVRLFEKTGSTWIQKGSNINGVSSGDGSGRSISLDSSGTVIAIGAPYNDASFGPFSQAGHVRIFHWTGSAWAQKGATLLADSAGDNYGYSVCLSADGNTLAVGAPFKGNKGRVNVYRWNTTAWVQLGDNLNGKADFDLFGNSVSISRDGNILAVGAPFNSDGATQAGQTQVFSWSDTDTAWIQMGSDINGAVSDYSGSCVSLANDGKTVAIGAPQDMIMGGFGSAKVYTWNNVAWIQKGTTITSPIFADQFGATTTLSKDGNTLAVGASSGMPGNDNGRAEVYNWNGSNWLLKGDTLKGTAINDQFGAAIDLSYDGQYVAIGAPVHNGSGPASGQVKAFIYSTCAPSTSTVPVSVCGTQYTSPSGKYTWTVNGMSYKDTIPNVGGCDSIMTIQLTLKPYPVVNLGNDTSACADSLLLDAGNTGAQFLWNTSATSQTIYAKVTGDYVATVTQNGCAANDTIVVTIKNPSSSSIAPTVCGTQYTSPSGKIWTTTGIYSDTLLNTMGCDSVITVNLTINPNPIVNLGSDTVGLCGNNSIVLDAGNPGASFKWYPDSTATSQTIIADTSGLYAVQVTKNGCSAISFINVTIKNPTTSSQNLTLCANTYTSPSGKYTWTISDTYMDTIANKEGCDSVMTIHLTLKPIAIVNLGNDIIAPCRDSMLVLDAGDAGAGASYLWNTDSTFQTLTVKSSGTYFVTVSMPNGCTTSDTVAVAIANLSMKTSINGIVFSVEDSGATSYTWLDCLQNKQPIPGANNQNYTAKGCVGDSVNFAVVVNKNGCIDTSDNMPFTIPFLQIGNKLNIGSSTQSIALSADENTMAVGTTFNGVTVYKKNNTTWESKGGVITRNGYWNQSVAVSADGNTVVVGWFIPGTSPTYTTIYKWTGTEWVQKGSEFGCEASSYLSVSMSADGNTIAYGDPYGHWPNGYANVYQWDQNTSAWVLKGNTIEGSRSSGFGTSVALSADANIIAVSAPKVTVGNGSNTGQIKVYQWNVSTSTWEQRGTEINGTTAKDYWGHSLSLSADGNTLISGGTDIRKDSIAYVRAFRYDGTNWAQKGSDFPTVSSNDVSKVIVSLSADGTRMVTSSYGSVNGNIAKKIKWDGRDWAQVGSNIVTSFTINCLAISAGGNMMILSPGFDVIEYDECTDQLPPVGIAEVFQNTNSNKDYPISLYPNPSTGSLTVKADNGIEKVEIYNIMGQVIYSSLFTNKTNEASINLSQNKAGIYFVKVTSEGQQTTSRLLLQP